MRIWDIAPNKLCRNHLLGEHGELHAIWVVLTHHKKGYANHPEVVRWRGKLKALFFRHEKLVKEMRARGYDHKSPVDKRQATGGRRQYAYVDLPERQVVILRNKKCDCLV